MPSRVEFHEKLVDVLGSKNVYFQPPESLKMNYPAIVYSRSNIVNTDADDEVYLQYTSYDVTVIDKDPDSEIVQKLSKFKYCRFSRHYTANNLNHDMFIIKY